MKPNRVLIEASNINKTFEEGKQILSKVSVQVLKNEVVGIWGPNGCGKSTLVKILAGLIPPDNGEGNINHSNEAVVGYVPQDPIGSLFPWYTSVKNLRIVLGHQKISKSEAEAILRKNETYDFDEGDLHTIVGRLSGGKRQRLAFACSIERNANCLLLDEPFSGLDTKSLEWTVKFIRTEAEMGKGFLIVTHDPEAAILTSDRIFMMKKAGNNPTVIEEEFSVRLTSRDFSEITADDFLEYRNRLLMRAFQNDEKSNE